MSQLLMAILMLLIAFSGIGWWTYILFALNGLVQSVGYPALFAIVSQWFPKRIRGTILGFWSSCASVGNMLGAIITVAILNKDRSWEAAYAIIGCISFGAIVLNIIFAREPHQVGHQV